MTALASHPQLYDALREAGATETRARAAEQATLPAAHAASKAEVEQKVAAEIRPVDRTLAKVWTAVSIIAGLSIATFFFAMTGWLESRHGAEVASTNSMAIAENRSAIAANALAIEANALAIAANAEAIAENRAAIEANAKAIAENRVAIEANAKAIAEVRQIALENRAAIQANSEKLDQLAQNQAEIARRQKEILRLLRAASAE